MEYKKRIIYIGNNLVIILHIWSEYEKHSSVLATLLIACFNHVITQPWWLGGRALASLEA